MLQKEPFNYSQYEKTYNTAIDLVAQAVGWARLNKKPLACVRLKPSYYDLFRKGMEVIMKKPLTGFEVFEFDGVNVEKGGMAQFESIALEYYIQAQA